MDRKSGLVGPKEPTDPEPTSKGPDNQASEGRELSTGSKKQGSSEVLGDNSRRKLKESWLAVDICTKLHAQARERQQEESTAKENKTQDCFRKGRRKDKGQESVKEQMDQEETRNRDAEEENVDSRAGWRMVKASSRAKAREIGESGPGPPGTDVGSEQK